jgi:hypothetical protein
MLPFPTTGSFKHCSVIAAVPAAVPTSHNGIRPVVPVFAIVISPFLFVSIRTLMNIKNLLLVF